MAKYYNKNYYNIKSIKDVIQKMTNNSYYSYEYKLNILKNKWNIIIGDNLSKISAPVKLYKTTLYVNCLHQGMINTLLFYKDIILSKIQENFKNILVVEDIIFKFGPLN